MLTTADFRKGLAILVEGQPYLIMDYSVQTPSARGSATLVRIKGRNVITGQVLDMTFKAGEKFQEPDLERRKINFLYAADDEFHFMDEQSFEQFHLDRETLQDAARWLREGITLRSVVFQGAVVGIELPQFVELKVVETGPGGRSDMASGKVTKPATLENGTQIRVPVYLDGGETVMVDTTTGEFVRRVSGK
ncbi:MAG: elongation factor P [Acidobacteria bacterium 13_1_20CM_2_68_14]|nr:MAG: elongation factor P [Acidobacteria bacterium 13_1_20CM_2_68_14]